MAIEVNVNLFGQFTEEHGDWFRGLLEELTNIVHLPDYSGRLIVVVAPHRQLGEAANAVLEVEAYTANGQVPRAIAIPITREGGLRCVILLSAESAESMTADTRPDELVSSLLEELLHVQVYATRWLQGGFSEGRVLAPLERDLRILSDRVHDEYFTCRRKGALSATLPLYDALGMPGYRTTRILGYGDNTAGLIEKAAGRLRELTSALAAGRSLEDVWPALSTVTFRGIYEPLARLAGFKAAIPEGEIDRSVGPWSSSFFRARVEVHWVPVRVALVRSYETDLEYMDTASNAVQESVRQFWRAGGLLQSENG